LVKIFKRGDEGKEQIIHIAKAGEMVGFRAMFTEEPYKVGAEALEESNICFIGKEDSMSFVATANLRVQRDSPESEFLKIVYELREDTEKDESGKLNEKRGRMLVRVTHPNAFSVEESREDRSQRTYPLLRGVQKLRFRYFRRDRDNGWSTTWDSDSPDMKDRYPDLIEVTLEVSAPPRQSFEGLFKFGPEAPLNGLDPTL
jgi:hypothetical protein